MNYHEVDGEPALLIDVSNIYYKNELGEYVPWVYHGLLPATAWGGITGILANQADLQGVLNLKAAQTAVDLKVDKVAGKQLSTQDYTTAEQTKLAGIAAGATVNATDAALRARTSHTGTQLASTVGALTGLAAGTDVAIAAADTLLVALAKLQAQITALKTP